MTADPAIRAALREAGEAARDAYEKDLDHRGIAAATVAAFHRALYGAADGAHFEFDGHMVWTGEFEELAAAVEAAAREGE